VPILPGVGPSRIDEGLRFADDRPKLQRRVENSRRDSGALIAAIIEGSIALAITIYGIKNCDTMKKARAWLDKHGVDYAFHDYKTAGIERERLERWCKKAGWEMLLNRAGTTFRKLPDKDKTGLDGDRAVALMLAQPSMIKRPVLDLGGGKLVVGFTPENYGAKVRA
jgi:arsenate reductase